MISHYVTQGSRPDLNDMGPGVPKKLKKLVESCWAQEVKHRPAVHGLYASCKYKIKNTIRPVVSCFGCNKKQQYTYVSF